MLRRYLLRMWARRAVTLNLKAGELLEQIEAICGEDDEDFLPFATNVAASTHELANILEGACKPAKKGEPA